MFRSSAGTKRLQEVGDGYLVVVGEQLTIGHPAIIGFIGYDAAP